MIYNFLDGGTPPANNSGGWITIAMTVGLVVVMYFILIRPQRKKEKEQNNMRSALSVGDEINTIGGIVGRIVSIKDDTLTIETGSDRIKLKVKRWAIQGKESE